MSSFIKQRILEGTKSTQFDGVVIEPASESDLQDFCKAIDELYDEPEFQPLPPNFYNPGGKSQ